MKVVFVDIVHPVLEEMLKKNGFTCIRNFSISPNQLKEEMAGVNGLVIRSRFTIDEEFLSLSPDLKFIARSGSGLENIAVDAADKRGIKIYNSPEGNRDAVAEHAIGMLLMLFNKLHIANEEVRNGIWDREGNRGLEICGKTIGIIGFGVMGKAFAQRLSGFGCRILAYDKYRKNFGNSFVEEVSLETLKSNADIISFHVPLTAETHYYLDHKFIAECTKNVVIINTSRGKVVETAALVAGLQNGKITGACLDVIEYEMKSFEKLETDHLPDAMQYLLQSDKVVLSPHVAGWTKESYIKLSTFLAEKILKDFGKQKN